MNAPGAAMVHKIVSKECRHRPKQDWMGEVQKAVGSAMVEIDHNWPLDSDMKIHVIVSVERPPQ